MLRLIYIFFALVSVVTWGLNKATKFTNASIKDGKQKLFS